MTERLVCRALSGGRGMVTAFRDVDLEVEAGTVLALLGPNGAGKTTLLLTLSGLLPAKAGEVEIDGQRLRSGRARAANRAGVVLVPDNRCLFPSLTVEENLRTARRARRAPREMLDIFPGLEKRWDVRAGALSGGEQQMLVMARALIQNPKVLLVDELSMGLAPQAVEMLYEAVGRITAEHGCAVVLVEQHVHLALEAADDAAVLNHGSIVLRGSPAELRLDPDALERAYLGSTEPPSVILADRANGSDR
jgi:branched-chain amino acid transport system ATP-binding protein